MPINENRDENVEKAYKDLMKNAKPGGVVPISREELKALTKTPLAHPGKNYSSVRAEVLSKALDATTGDRNASYGAPTPNLNLAADLIALYHKAAGTKYSKAHDQAIYLALHKLARIACGAVGHTDNYIDAAAYFAIAAECEIMSGPRCLGGAIEDQNQAAATANIRRDDSRGLYSGLTHAAALLLDPVKDSDGGMVNPYKRPHTTDESNN